ncbi:MAG: helix-turn-helix domain-containing protein [Anaerolineae bacterium]|nr:helix-turn-helix domain-containing protein [Anaerolineae bacterium]
MPKLIRLEMSESEREELAQIRNRDPRPYMREKAAALLKIADGAVAAQVAENGLLKKHDPDVVYRWLKNWQTEGIAGLVVKQGRGRKPSFSP